MSLQTKADIQEFQCQSPGGALANCSELVDNCLVIIIFVRMGMAEVEGDKEFSR